MKQVRGQQTFNFNLNIRFPFILSIGKKRWVDILEKITQNYNNTFHNSIGMPPSHVTLANTEKIRNKLYGGRPSPKCDLKKGDVVRIPIEKSIFKKGTIFTLTQTTLTILSY